VTEIPTVTDNLFSQGTITANEIGVSFQPTTTVPEDNGELTWGMSWKPHVTVHLLTGGWAVASTADPSSIFVRFVYDVKFIIHT